MRTFAVIGFVVFATLSECALGQDSTGQITWPAQPFYRTYEYAPSRYGMIVMKNNDTMRGYIKIRERVYFFWKPGQRKYLTINPKKVNIIRVFNPLNTRLYTELRHVDGKHILWKLIKEKNGVSIYDGAMYPYFENYDKNGHLFLAPRLVLVHKGKRTKLFNFFTVMFHGSDLKKLMLRFINRHYKLHLDENHFGSPDDMIDFILNKENAN